MQEKKRAHEREIDHPSLDPDVLANYRPISLLPFTSKVSGAPAEERSGLRCFSQVLELITAHKRHLLKLLMILL